MYKGIIKVFVICILLWSILFLVFGRSVKKDDDVRDILVEDVDLVSESDIVDDVEPTEVIETPKYDDNTGAYLESYLALAEDSPYFQGGVIGMGTTDVDEIWSYGGFEDVHPVGVLDVAGFNSDADFIDWLSYMSKWCYCYYGVGEEGYIKLALYITSDEFTEIVNSGDCHFHFVSRSVGADPSEWFIEVSKVEDTWSVVFDLTENKLLSFKGNGDVDRICYIVGFSDEVKVALDDVTRQKPRLVIRKDAVSISD